MTPEEKKELNKHIDAIGKILYKQAKPEQVETLRIRATGRMPSTPCGGRTRFPRVRVVAAPFRGRPSP